jgi:hypothetical protein
MVAMKKKINFRYKFGNGGLAKAGNSAKIEYQPQQYIPDSSDRKSNQDTDALYKEVQLEKYKRELETKRKIQEDAIKFQKLSEDLKNVRNPLKGMAPTVNKSTFTQDNKNSPYNPLFAPTMVPDYGNSQKGYEASKFVGSQNALDQAFNAAGGLPIGELVGAGARFLPEIKGAAGAILETGKELVERVAGKELAKEATHHYVAHENMHSLTPGNHEQTSGHEETPKNKFGGKLKVKNKKRWKIID